MPPIPPLTDNQLATQQEMLRRWASEAAQAAARDGLASTETRQLLALYAEFCRAPLAEQQIIMEMVWALRNQGIRNMGILTAFEIVGRLLHFLSQEKTLCGDAS